MVSALDSRKMLVLQSSSFAEGDFSAGDKQKQIIMG